MARKAAAKKAQQTLKAQKQVVLTACATALLSAGILARPACAERDHKMLLLAGKYYLVNHPNDTRTLASVGGLEIEFGSYDDAIKHLSKAIELSPFENAYYIDRADAYLHRGDYEKAIADANMVMKSTNGT